MKEEQRFAFYQRYTHQMEKYRGEILAIALTCILTVVGFCVIAMLSKLAPDDWYYFPLFMGGFSFCWCCMPYRQYDNARKMRELTKKYPVEDSGLIIKAHEEMSKYGVATWVLDTSFEKPIRARVFTRMMTLFIQYSKANREELEKKRKDAGIDNPHNEWFGIGRTVEDAALQAAYIKKLNSEQAVIKATEDGIIRVEASAKSAPSVERRKELEMQRAAIEQELARLTNQSQVTMPESVRTEKPVKETGLEDY
jgi:hypothetical protein